MASQRETGGTAGRSPTGGQHAPGETSGSPQRPPQKLAGIALTFDLAGEIDRLLQEPAYRQGDRNAKTLLKDQDLRIVLTTLAQGAQIREHDVHGQFTIQALRGRVRVQVAGEAVELPAGHLMSVRGGIAHDVLALEQSAILLTIAASPGGMATGS
jgi:quercetin dioxygenase-like cupin family protein